MKNEPYEGFEQGIAKPPVEANSLFLRISRNCPWNRCTFCPIYESEKFSLRPVEHVMEDINMVHKHAEVLLKLSDGDGMISHKSLIEAKKRVDKSEYVAFHAARNWISAGMKSIFIQDADSLVIKPSDLIKILLHIKKCFPMAEKITSYARSHTIVRISDENLKKIADAGLNRIYIGLESGSDNVLKFTKKGCLKKDHIKAGKKVKKAGMELSENIMAGLGGKKYSKEHALESADTVNQINPDSIRLLSFAMPDKAEQFADISKDWFEKCTDIMMAKEILLFIRSLDGITSTVKSDHILNLLEDVNGTLPRDKLKMTGIIEKFLDMDPGKQMIYQIGRRSGIFSSTEDLDNTGKVMQIEQKCRQQGITPGNADEAVSEMTQRFV